MPVCAGLKHVALCLAFFVMSLQAKANPTYDPAMAGIVGTVVANGAGVSGTMAQTKSGSNADGQTAASFSAVDGTNAAQANSLDSLVITLAASASGVAGSTGVVTASASTTFFAELIGPSLPSPPFSQIELNVKQSLVTHSGGSVYYYDNCLFSTSCNTYNNYGYTELTMGGGLRLCNGINAQFLNCPYSLILGGFSPALNTPEEITLSVIAVASGAGAASELIQFSVEGAINGFGSPQPSGYQLVFAPTIASLPSYSVSEPPAVSILAFALLMGWPALKRRRRIEPFCPV